jgi:hypothetical protein
MEHFKPPTDNLYKFLALSGVLLVIFTLYLPFSMMNELRLMIDLLQPEASSLEAKVDFWNEDKEILEARQSIASDEEKEDLEQRKRILETRIAFANAKMEAINRLGKQMMVYEKYIKVFAVFGWCLVFLGFGLWYSKLQKFEDKKIKRETEKEIMSPENIDETSPLKQ